MQDGYTLISWCEFHSVEVIIMKLIYLLSNDLQRGALERDLASRNAFRIPMEQGRGSKLNS